MKPEKNYVAMETLLCPVCGVKHSHGAGILLHKRLQNIDPEKTTTGYGMCEEHQRLFDEGYIALIGVENSDPGKDTLKMEEAYRTGEVCHLKKDLFNQIFNVEVDEELPLVFVDAQVIAHLQQLESTATH